MNSFVYNVEDINFCSSMSPVLASTFYNYREKYTIVISHLSREDTCSNFLMKMNAFFPIGIVLVLPSWSSYFLLQIVFKLYIERLKLENGCLYHIKIVQPMVKLLQVKPYNVSITGLLLVKLVKEVDWKSMVKTWKIGPYIQTSLL